MVTVEVKKVKLSSIKLNPENPRTISNADMDRLVKSLKEFPEMMKMREIVVDETMTALGGNMRLLGLRQIGEDDCIAKIVKGLTPEQKREFIIKDNSQFGEWDMELLGSQWDSLPLAEWGVDIPKSWSNEPPEGPDGSSDEEPPEKPQIIICPKCNHEFSILKEKKDK